MKYSYSFVIKTLIRRNAAFSLLSVKNQQRSFLHLILNVSCTTPNNFLFLYNTVLEISKIYFERWLHISGRKIKFIYVHHPKLTEIFTTKTCYYCVFHISPDVSLRSEKIRLNKEWKVHCCMWRQIQQNFKTVLSRTITLRKSYHCSLLVYSTALKAKMLFSPFQFLWN